MKVKHLKNKKGSMMMDYFVVTAVGIILLGALMFFLTEGRGTVQNILGKVKSTEQETQEGDTLGTFY